MPRDLGRLSRTPWDVLVVGGGIHGLFLAYEAASRGLSVALVERDDFGSGLSFNHQRTVHGGLRALERGDLRGTRQQIAERRTWAVIAPHLIRPLPFLLGTYTRLGRSRLLIGTGFALYDWLGRRRNDGLPPSLHLPPSAVWSRDRTIEAFAGIDVRGLTGGAVWYDYQVRHPDRLNWTVAQAATEAGARLVNYAEATAPAEGRGHLIGVQVRDVLDGSTHDIRARATVIAAGSATGDLLHRFGARQATAPPLVHAANLVVDRPAAPLALAAPGSTGRVLTAVPWAGVTLIGTWQSDEPVEPRTSPGVSAETLRAMLADTNAAFPGLRVSEPDVRVVHHGLTPAVVRGARTELLPASRLLTPDAGTRPGLFAVIGVKFTTARQTAQTSIDRIARDLGKPIGASRTHTAPLPHATLTDAAALVRETGLEDLDAASRAHLVDWYGSEAPAVARFALDRALTDPLDAGTPVLAGEIGYAAVHSQAARLADAVLRRTRLGSTGHPGDAALARAAEVMARACGWSPERQAEEIAGVLARYPTRPGTP